MTVSVASNLKALYAPACSLTGRVGFGLAGIAVCALLVSPPAYARGEQAGVSAAVRGDVELAEAKGIVGTQVESGQPIYLGDYITSSPGSGMQILLMDETVFTIGPNSEIAIDDFVYDPANNQGHMSASITRGVVRVLTGKLAHNDPKTMKINSKKVITCADDNKYLTNVTLLPQKLRDAWPVCSQSFTVHVHSLVQQWKRFQKCSFEFVALRKVRGTEIKNRKQRQYKVDKNNTR